MTFNYKIRQVDTISITATPTQDSQAVTKNYTDNAIATAVAAKSITLTGDATGSGTSIINMSLSNTGVLAGTYATVTVDSKGRVTTGQSLTLSGEVTGVSLNGSLVTALNNTGVIAGSYTKVTVDSKGRVTSATNLSSNDVTTALGFAPVNVNGSTMTGPLILNENPTQDLQAVTKEYVDRRALFALAVGIY